MAENQPPFSLPASFAFQAPGIILFGEGKSNQLGECARKLGARPVVITGATTHRHATLLAELDTPLVIAQGREPTLADLEAATAQARSHEADMVIGLGGGSALDLAKATAAMLTNPGSPLDYLEVVGRGLPLEVPALPIIAIPTTSGTGSEATRNAVLACPEHRVKVSMRHPSMLPTVAIVDPQLCHGLPPAVTACTGLDALTQLIEPFVSRMANPFTDAICRSALPRAVAALRTLQRHPDDCLGRCDLCYASLCGGLALANAGLGAVHGIAGPLGGMLSIPHGTACALLLPAVFATNWALAEALPAGEPRRQRFKELWSLIAPDTGDPLSVFHELQTGLGAAGLNDFGLHAKQVPELASKAALASSMRGNPFKLSQVQLETILRQSL